MDKSIDTKIFRLGSAKDTYLLLPAYAERLIPYSKNSRSNLKFTGNIMALTVAFEYSGIKKAGAAMVLRIYINPPSVASDMTKIASKNNIVIYGVLCNSKK